MRTVDFKLEEKTYQLKLTTSNLVQLERKLGAHPMTLLMDIENNILPKTEDLLWILFYALQWKYENSFEDFESVESLYDKYVDEGNDYTKLIVVIVELFRVSGLIPNNKRKNL